MSNIVMMNYAMVYFLNLKYSYINSLTIGLFAEDLTPAFNDPLSKYNSGSAVPTFQGYDPLPLTDCFSGGAVADGMGAAYMTGTPLIWTPTGTLYTNTIYGYYVYDDSDNLWFAQSFNPDTYSVGGTLVPFYLLPVFYEGSY